MTTKLDDALLHKIYGQQGGFTLDVLRAVRDAAFVEAAETADFCLAEQMPRASVVRNILALKPKE